ncbi:MAG TPA: polysaccharide lyase 8 family protein [Candidatus Bathyarchaeia archaeon]|nr:polysaccharide lyase 8 family protein [Candidatus Bathyarchaeia archaeon]
MHSVWKTLGVFAVLFSMITLVFSDSVGQVQGQDTYDSYRIRWKELITGGRSYDPNDRMIKPYIESLDATVGYRWRNMNKEGNRTYLWADLNNWSNPEHITSTYMRIRELAVAYATKGSKYENDQQLKNDIVEALDWLYEKKYNENTKDFGNWWSWELGIPLQLTEIMIILYDDLTSEQIKNYTNAIDRFSTRQEQTGSGRAKQALIWAAEGLVLKDSRKLNEVQEIMNEELLGYANRNRGLYDGFYEDGSYINHYKQAYTGSYGVEYLQNVADLVYILNDTQWRPNNSKIRNVNEWVYHSFEPLVYKGEMMDMVRGRDISRQDLSSHFRGHQAISAIMRLAEMNDSTDAKRMKQMVKYWIQEDKQLHFMEKAKIFDRVLANRILKDSSIRARGELVMHKQFPMMDRVVHHRPGFAFAISMSSRRTYNYEAVNGENLKGWYTGEGMTYLYTDDQGQYSDNFWPTVNPYRMPGTTVDTRSRKNGSDQTLSYPTDWVGGAELNGEYGAVGMQLDPYNTTLTAKKSWFMFDDEIVAMGTDINSKDGRTIETIIENRKLNSKGNNGLRINGKPISTSLGWKDTVANVHSIYIDDVGGYFLPVKKTVKGIREKRTGSWKDINYTQPSQKVSNNFLTLWFDHGRNPSNEKYAYILYPNQSYSNFTQYVRNPEAHIIRDTSSIHAVREETLGIIAVNFWEDGEVEGIRSESPASVVMQENNGEITLAISDPTHNQETLEIELERDDLDVSKKDSTIKVQQTSPTLVLEIDVEGSNGKTHQIKLKTK